MAASKHQILITQFGFDHLKSELSDLVDNRRPALVVRLSNARSQGDLSENSDYQSAKEELAFLDGRIAELEDVIRLARITSPKGNTHVDFGHKVTVKNSHTQIVFTLVGEWESDPSAKKISHTSPLGQALMGKQVGDKIEVTAPVGKITYTVLAIE